MNFKLFDKVKNDEVTLTSLFSVTTSNVKVSLISITNTYNVAKSFTLVNITILKKGA